LELASHEQAGEVTLPVEHLLIPRAGLPC
jgi:hypothetical protein